MSSVEHLIRAVKRGSARAAEQLGMLESEVRGGLGAQRGEAIAALVEALAHPNNSVRFEAAWALASFNEGVTSAIPRLVKLLTDPDPATRSQAAETLGRVGITPQFIPELVDALGADDPVIRAGAAEALAHLGPEARDAVPTLRAALADPDKDVRVSAATTLGEVGPDAGVAMPSLFRLVISEDSEDQIYVVEAIVNICQKSAPAAQMLRDLLGASGDQVRGSSASALRRVAGLE